jgi:hypothetical protein
MFINYVLKYLQVSTRLSLQYVELISHIHFKEIYCYGVIWKLATFYGKIWRYQRGNQKS